VLRPQLESPPERAPGWRVNKTGALSNALLRNPNAAALKPEGSVRVGLHWAKGVLGHRPCDARAEFADALSFADVGNAACNIGRKPIHDLLQGARCLKYGGN
jgi:hypothetical protein